MPTFTVLVNNYNYLKYLPATLDSIRAQTFGDYQLIVVDDGSTDGSLEYLAARDDLTLVRSARQGQARACRQALARATGAYLYILDADDFAGPTLLERVAANLAGSPAKVQVRMQPVDAAGVPFAAPLPAFPAGYDAAAQITEIHRTGACTSPPTSGNVFRRDVLDAVGDVDYETAIDGVALLAAPHLGPVVTLDEALASYRVHTESDSAHARPLNLERIVRDRLRLGQRIDHLNRIIAERRLPHAPVAPGPSFFYFWDQLSLERVVAGQGIGPGLFLRYLRLLVREHGLTTYSARKCAWLLTAALGPRRSALALAATRLNPWPRRAAAARAVRGRAGAVGG